MDYYLYNKIKKDLSNPFETQEDAEIHLSKLNKYVQENFKIIHFPEIREGLKLFTEKGYYRTIVGSSGSLWFLNYTDGRKVEDIHDVFTKETVIKNFINGTFCKIEEYEDDTKVEHFRIDTSLLDGEEFKEEESEEL